MHLCGSSSNVPRLPSSLDMLQNPRVSLTFGKVQNPLRLPRKPHLNPQKWSEHEVLSAFWLGNLLRATTACTFSTSQLPKVVRTWCALHILTSKCASRHNGVQLFISHLPRRLRTRRFSEPTFRPSGATNHWKNIVFHDFSTFSRTCIFCLLAWLFSLLFSDSSHLCFFICPYCRNFDFLRLKNSFSTNFQGTGPWESPIHFSSRFVLRVHKCSKLFQSWSWSQEKKGRPFPKAIAKFKAQTFSQKNQTAY